MRGLKKAPIEYYKMLYGDTSTNGSVSAMRCGHDFLTTDHCVFAPDSPLDPIGGAHLIGGTIDAINALEIPDAEKETISSGNARRLLKLH
jgi:predicted TIM-barrel fold metal-dependent hydrolase